tara:strand:+ start:971 stop:1435 length:465 start_codon:yes stop_codon:yes gene_type:complete
MFFNIKHYCNKLLLFFLLFILLNCQLQEPVKNHGILFLENRSNKLVLNNSNKNDTLKIFGQPHTRSLDNDDQWIYIERTLSKGKFHKLGQHTLKTNNVLILTFDKYGVLKNKDFYNKNDIKKISFSKKSTENKLSKKSFVESFLSSVKEKMYGN